MTNTNTLILHDKLVVGFDGSDDSIAALRWAAKEAEVRNASVTVIASYATSPAVAYGWGVGFGGVELAAANEDLAEWTRTELATRVHEVFAAHPAVGHDYHAVATRPGSAILDAAEGADLVVVGRSGAGALGRLLLGSVSAELLVHSPCPVAVIPSAPDTTGGPVVVAVDGSEGSARAVRWAVDEADRHASRLTVAHCWKAPYTLTSEGLDRAGDLRKVDAQLVLDAAVEAAREVSGGDVDHRLVEGGTVDSLIDLSRAADLVVLGSRGRGGFTSMLLGSVAHAVASHAHCPTVIVR